MSTDHRRVRSVLPFVFNSEGFFKAQPQRIFRVHGLAVWAPPGAHVDIIITSNVPSLRNLDRQIQSGSGLIPARFFSLGKSFEEICKLVDAGSDLPGWCNWPTLQPGHDVIIRVVSNLVMQDIIGPNEGVELIAWGEALL